jgi:hypothetical protein
MALVRSGHGNLGKTPNPPGMRDNYLARALEQQLISTVKTLERPFENIPDEFAREVVETYGGAKSTIREYCAADVSCIALKPCLTFYSRVTDAQRDDGWFTATARGRRYTIPLAVIWTRPGIAKRQREQQRGD